MKRAPTETDARNSPPQFENGAIQWKNIYYAPESPLSTIYTINPSDYFPQIFPFFLRYITTDETWYCWTIIRSYVIQCTHNRFVKSSQRFSFALFTQKLKLNFQLLENAKSESLLNFFLRARRAAYITYIVYASAHFVRTISLKYPFRVIPPYDVKIRKTTRRRRRTIIPRCTHFIYDYTLYRITSLIRRVHFPKAYHFPVIYRRV